MNRLLSLQPMSRKGQYFFIICALILISILFIDRHGDRSGQWFKNKYATIILTESLLRRREGEIRNYVYSHGPASGWTKKVWSDLEALQYNEWKIRRYRLYLIREYNEMAASSDSTIFLNDKNLPRHIDYPGQ